MAEITVNGVRLVYDRHGDTGLPPLFLLHGLYGSRHLGATIDLFSDRYHIITYDARGHGDSDKPAAYALKDHGQDLLALIAGLGYDKAVVIGLSMGSYVAAQAAILDSSRIDKLVLLVTKGHGKSSSVVRFLTGKGLDPLALTPEELIKVMSEAIWSPHTTPERRQAIMAEQLMAMPADYHELTAEQKQAVDAALTDFDLRPGLALISAPTLVIAGRDDGLNPPELGAEVAALIPDARFVVFEESGHMLIVEEPDHLRREVLAFLNDSL